MKVNKNFCILSKKLWLKILNFFQKISKFWEFFGIWFFIFLVHFLYFVTYGRKYWADIMFWISWFCSLLLVKWPIFGQLFGLISQKATTGWFSFWLFSTYLCMYFMKLKWFFMVHDLFETEASQPLCVSIKAIKLFGFFHYPDNEYFFKPLSGYPNSIRHSIFAG